MKRMNKKVIFIILVTTMIILNGISCSFGQAKKTVSSTVVLGPTTEKLLTFKIYKGDTLSISIDVSGYYVILYIYESEGYDNYYEETYDIYTSFETDFDPYYTDTFYFVIYNPSTTESSSVSYTFVHDEAYKNGQIANLSVTGGVFALIVVLNFTGKKVRIDK